jgi:hypothetical protein
VHKTDKKEFLNASPLLLIKMECTVLEHYDDKRAINCGNSQSKPTTLKELGN